MPTEAPPEYLTTRELAALLRITERKVYDLAAAGAVPCVKVTGKLLFPAHDISGWLASGRIGPAPEAPPPGVFLGSHDPLLDWALRESRCGLATFFDGSHDGLTRFRAREGVAAGLHIHEEAGGWNSGAAASACAGMNAVLLGFATRRRGLITMEGAGVHELAELPGKRFAPRQPESGSQPLFQSLLQAEGVALDTLTLTAPMRSEADAAHAVASGAADAAFGLEVLATQYGLGFAPLIEERFDLLVDRRACFEPPLQGFFDFCRSEAFQRRAAETPGYDVTGLGLVRWNG